MNPKWVMTEDEVKMKKERKFLAIQHHGEDRFSSIVTNINVTMPLTNEEIMKLKNMLDQKLVIACECVVKGISYCLDQKSANLQTCFMALFHGQKFDFETIRGRDKQQKWTFQSVASQVDEMKELPVEDQQKLMEQNYALAYGLITSSVFHPKDFQLRTQKFRETLTSKLLYLPEAKRVWAYMWNAGFFQQQPRLQYEQVYSSPWAPNIMIEERHREIILEIQTWMRDSADDPMDPIRMILIWAICLFSSEFVELQRKDMVEKTQQKFIDMLYRYLKLKYDEKASSKLAEGLMIATLARQAYDMHMNMLPV